MATLNEIIARAEALRKESYVNSIDPERVGSIMSDTLKYLNEFQLQSGSMGLDKIYTSISAMNADTSPVSDLTGKPLKAGQLAVIVAGSASEDNGKVYRFDNPGWTYVSTIGNLNIVQETGDSETAVMSQKAVTNLIEELKNAGYVFAGIATPETNPGTPDQNVFYLATEPGIYSNFNGIEVGYNEAIILHWNNSTWTKEESGFATTTQVEAVIGSSSTEVEFVSKPGYYWNGYSYVEFASFNSTEQIPVTKGSIIQVLGRGGQNARLVYYYNTNGKNLFISGPLSESDIVSIFEDGYIICNTNISGTIKVLQLSDKSIIAQNTANITDLKENQENLLGNLVFPEGEAIPDSLKNGILEFSFYATDEVKAAHTNFKLASIGWFENTKRVIAQITATKTEDSSTTYFSGVMLTNVASVDDLPAGVNEYNYFIENYGLHIIINFDIIKANISGGNAAINPITLESDNPYVTIAQNTANIAQNTAVIFEDMTDVNNTDLVVGYFYNTSGQSVGDIHTNTPSKITSGSPTSWGCIKLSVIKGSTVVIKAKGDTNGRAYALTDRDRKILVLADADVDTINSPVTLTVEEDGYLYVNQNGTTLEGFGVSIRKDKITPVINIVIDKKSYDNSVLEVGYYYSFGNSSVGNTAPSNPTLYQEGSTTWGCIKLSVTKGSTVVIKAKGSTNGRAYALTDKDRKILVLADADVNTINSPVTLTVEEDGYLYVNQNGTTLEGFGVSIESTIENQIESLSDRVIELEENPVPSTVAPHMYNPPLNLQKEQLRVLDIGNSYTGDSTHYLPQIVEASGVDLSNICLYTAVRGGASFKNWFDIYHDQDTYSYGISKLLGELSADISGTAAAGNGEKFRNTLANNEWDLIIIHQVSNFAPYYDRWEEDGAAGYLSKFIRLLRKHQPKATIGFLLVHSYWSGYGGNTEGSSLERWKLIAESAKKLRANYGIDFVIPYGTAIQNLRASSLNNDYDLTADGTHCANGLADYTAACAYFQALFAPRYGVTILGNTARITVEPTETYPSSDISVTDENAPVAQKAAFLASYNWYECINPDDIDDEDLI